MLKDKMAKALNTQINKEMYSAYLYLAMSAYSEHIGLSGFANWFQIQYQEEMFHAMKMFHYLQEQGSQVVLETIEKPQTEFKGPMDMLETTLAHEKTVTQSINDLMDLAQAEKDHATQIFLQWFVSEQVEEEASVSELIGKLNLAGEKGNGLFMIDKEMGQRVFTAPAEEG